METRDIDGILLVDKPKGPTSQKVVEKIKRGCRLRAGHAGTLDPAATGVLVVCVGRGTRLSGYLTACEKEYRATVRLGAETDTMDATGKVLSTAPVPQLDQTAVEHLIEEMVGEMDQIPPMFSAKRVDGKRLYQLARAGIEVERKPKRIKVTSARFLSLKEDEVTFEVRCSSGTYVRVLASDIGKSIGSGGHLDSLVRLAVGPFTLERCNSLEEIIGSARQNKLDSVVIPMSESLPWLPRIDLDDRVVEPLVYGTSIRLPNSLSEETDQRSGTARVCTTDGKLICIARVEYMGSEMSLSPEKVFLKPSELI